MGDNLHLQIVTRPTAKTHGLKKYFTGLPCKQGHISEKYTTSGSCIQCFRIRGSSEARVQYEREYYRANRERVLVRSQKYHARNRQRNIENAKRWIARNPEKRRIVAMNYKAKRRAQEGVGVSTGELSAWAAAQRKCCYWCGVACKDSYHIDHYEPLAKGGAHELHNLVIACPSCNFSKSAKDPYQFAAQVGRLF